MSTSQERLLQANPHRYVMFPIELDPVWKMYKQQVASFWTPEELKLDQDLVDWKRLTESEQHFIKTVLAFFAASDGIVLENIVTRFLTEIEVPEVRAFYTFQSMMENIHSETYSLLIDTYITDVTEKKHLFEAIDHIPCVKAKADWALAWMNADAPFAQRLLAFVFVEGIFFSGSFCAIFWLKKRGLLPGLSFSNELISRDEGMHCDFATLLYTQYVSNKLSQAEVYRIIDEAVQIEINFVCKALPVSLIGMNATLMSTYIKSIADRLLVSLGYEAKYGAKCPFPFMDAIAMRGITNFFEGRVSQYKKRLDFNVSFNLEDDDF